MDPDFLVVVFDVVPASVQVDVVDVVACVVPGDCGAVPHVDQADAAAAVPNAVAGAVRVDYGVVPYVD